MTENSFAFRLKELLEHKKVTPQAVANALDVSRPAVHTWTRGGEIDYEKLRKLAGFPDVNWIMDDPVGCSGAVPQSDCANSSRQRVARGDHGLALAS